ncbi:MAG TPA: sensor domain-containing diguanylate cyclase [Oligoflexia bacterium]|nr:sensor domain-containing diguanylate cyclase [Oligoflexia bacterium]
MRVDRLSANRVFGLLERNMRKAPRWNALERADAIFEETCRNFVELLGAKRVAVYLDDPLTKSGDKIEEVRLVCVAAVGAEAGSRVPVGGGPLGLCYRQGRMVRGGAILYVPIVMGRSTVGVVEAKLKTTIAEDTRSKTANARGRLAQTLCSYFSAALQNVLDAQKKLERERRDALTGLASGQELDLFLRARVGKATASRPVSVIFLDLDFFKSVNDTWGHLVGSQLLADIGESLRRTLVQFGRNYKKNFESLVARYGGDEFVVVLMGPNVDDSLGLAETIRARIASKKGLSRPITASLGLAWTGSGVRRRDYRALLKAADEAMYEAKRLGRNRVVVSGKGDRHEFTQKFT